MPRTILAERFVDVPKDVKIKVKSRVVTVVGPRGKLTKDFRHLNVAVDMINARKSPPLARPRLPAASRILCRPDALHAPSSPRAPTLTSLAPPSTPLRQGPRAGLVRQAQGSRLRAHCVSLGSPRRASPGAACRRKFFGLDFFFFFRTPPAAPRSRPCLVFCAPFTARLTSRT